MSRTCDRMKSLNAQKRALAPKTKAEEKLINEALVAFAALQLSKWGPNWNPAFNRAAKAVLKERTNKL